MRTPSSPIDLRSFQAHVQHFEEQRSFSGESAIQKCLLLGEEVGELFKAVRQLSNIGVDGSSERRDLSCELADVLILVAAIANRFGVDLSDALAAKQLLNRDRTWSIDGEQKQP